MGAAGGAAVVVVAAVVVAAAGGAKLLSAVALSGAPVLTLSTVTDAARVRFVSAALDTAAAATAPVTVGELGDVW